MKRLYIRQKPNIQECATCASSERVTHFVEREAAEIRKISCILLASHDHKVDDNVRQTVGLGKSLYVYEREEWRR